MNSLNLELVRVCANWGQLRGRLLVGEKRRLLVNTQPRSNVTGVSMSLHCHGPPREKGDGVRCVNCECWPCSARKKLPANRGSWAVV
jgi:hypothetical protein